MDSKTRKVDVFSRETLEAERLACFEQWRAQVEASPTFLPPLSTVDGKITDSRSTAEGWHLKALKFPTGDVELLAIRLTADDRLKGGGGKRENDNKDGMKPEVLRKSQYRAKQKVRHKLLTLGADRILTLTYRENMTDIEQAWKDFRAFNKRMKHRFGEKWQYLCVPEFQKRGAVHFHLAIKGYYNVNVVRKFWRDVVGEGNIDITSPGKYQLTHTDRKNSSWNPKKIANYLAKYITKQDAVAFNKRRYSSSKIELPVAVTGWLAVGMDMFYFMYRLVEKLAGVDLGQSEYFEHDGYFRVAKLST